jgi:hypothetical protein
MITGKRKNRDAVVCLNYDFQCFAPMILRVSVM